MNTHKSLIYMKHWIPDISLFTLKSDYLMKVWGNNRFAWHGINWFIFILLSCISGYLCIVVSCFFWFLHGRYLDINKQYTAIKNVLTKYVNTLYCHQPFRVGSRGHYPNLKSKRQNEATIQRDNNRLFTIF